MQRINVEIKARTYHPEEVHELLAAQQAEFIGTDRQTDTYYKVPKGRLKLRQGNIEKALIHYFRDNEAGPKRSDVSLYKTGKQAGDLHEVLCSALDTLAIVVKRRSIYFIENVKFHIDEVEGLGSFIEIEAIDKTGKIGEEKLRQQCQYYLNLFKVQPKDLIEVSYSDMVIAGAEANA
ncbi:class IV adenylate cyclase [Phaeodactylibacter luteus]|uniref:Class IV adenylate cyclase n=1 Tax=Phaeodactylibacter luteus TaxID=1564516 RepID=A0A5C6RH87_9BACT|nr:class IV adenylate cyclase [Phaeodactylibacter luteus]TXB61444.1 class IV adenylate cyclase [Phaeodactylibacter luteus]